MATPVVFADCVTTLLCGTTTSTLRQLQPRDQSDNTAVIRDCLGTTWVTSDHEMWTNIPKSPAQKATLYSIGVFGVPGVGKTCIYLSCKEPKCLWLLPSRPQKYDVKEVLRELFCVVENGWQFHVLRALSPRTGKEGLRASSFPFRKAIESLTNQVEIRCLGSIYCFTLCFLLSLCSSWKHESVMPEST